MHSYFATCPEFASDDFADLFAPAAPVVADIAPPMLPFAATMQRSRGIAGPEVGGMLDGGFLLACDAAARSLGSTAFADLVAWRQPVAEQRLFTGYMPADQRRAVRHREYKDGMRVKPLRKAVA